MSKVDEFHKLFKERKEQTPKYKYRGYRGASITLDETISYGMANYEDRVEWFQYIREHEFIPFSVYITKRDAGELDEI